MARQRRGQSGGDAHGRRRGARLAIAALIAATTAGCPFDGPTGPLNVGRGPGGGTGGGQTGSPDIAGSWRNVLATPTSVTDTRWSFTGGGACARTVVKTLLDAGVEDTVVRACTFTLTGRSLAVVFAGSTFVSSFTVAFSGGDLLLDGFRFHRTA